MTGLLRRTSLCCLFLIALGSTIPTADACPFCSEQGRTLVSDAAEADMILFGRLKNAIPPKGDDLDGSTDLVIDSIVKDNAFRAGKTVVTLPRYIPVLEEKDKKYKFLVFCTIFKGKLDPYKGLAVNADSDMAKYLKGVITLEKAPVEKRLRFAFDYLDNTDLEISNDAYKEFANADYKDYAGIAKTLPADKIAKWLKDGNTPSFRYGLYGSMLGHCGTEEHASLLRAMVADPEKRAGSGVDGMLAGYIMLKPKEGWEYARSVLADRKNEFVFRYAVLRTARFFYDTKTDILKREDLVDGLSSMITQDDISDLAIEDLRKWNRVEMTDRILALKDKRVFGLFRQPAYELSLIHI